MYNNPHPLDPQYQQQYNQYPQQQGGIPMQQYHQPQQIHYDPVITPQHAMSPMGASPPLSSSPAMNDPMIDGLSFFPALVVKQKRNSFWEYICNCEEENKYAIFNPAGNSKEKILTAKEKSGYCTRMCLAEKRHFHMSIRTNDDQEALYFERPYRLMERGGWCCCSSGCGYQALRVYGGEASKSVDSMLGYVREDYYLVFPVLSVYDEGGSLTYRLKLKPTCQSFCCGFAKATFQIFEASDKNCSKEVGKIKKKWSGLLKEAFTDADNFFVEFPVNASARQRAVLLGALLFIDYLYYEDGGCHLLHYLTAPLAGPCACLSWCGSCLSNCSKNSIDN